MERAGHVSRARLASTGAAALRVEATPLQSSPTHDLIEPDEPPSLTFDELSDARQLAIALSDSWSAMDREKQLGCRWPSPEKDEAGSDAKGKRKKGGGKAALKAAHPRAEEAPKPSLLAQDSSDVDTDETDMAVWRCRTLTGDAQDRSLECGFLNEYTVAACALCGGPNPAPQLTARVSALLQTCDPGRNTARQLLRRLRNESGTPGTGITYSGAEVQAEMDRQLSKRGRRLDTAKPMGFRITQQDADSEPNTTLTAAVSRLARSQARHPSAGPQRVAQDGHGQLGEIEESAFGGPMAAQQARQDESGAAPMSIAEAIRAGSAMFSQPQQGGSAGNAAGTSGRARQAGEQPVALGGEPSARIGAGFAESLIGKILDKEPATGTKLDKRRSKRVASEALARPLAPRTIAHLLDTCQDPTKVPSTLDPGSIQKTAKRMKRSQPLVESRVTENVRRAWHSTPSALPAPSSAPPPCQPGDAAANPEATLARQMLGKEDADEEGLATAVPNQRIERQDKTSSSDDSSAGSGSELNTDRQVPAGRSGNPRLGSDGQAEGSRGAAGSDRGEQSRRDAPAAASAVGGSSASAFHRWAEPQQRGPGGLGASKKLRPFLGVDLGSIKKPAGGDGGLSAAAAGLPKGVRAVLQAAEKMGVQGPALTAAAERLAGMLGVGGGL